MGGPSSVQLAGHPFRSFARVLNWGAKGAIRGALTGAMRGKGLSWIQGFSALRNPCSTGSESKSSAGSLAQSHGAMSRFATIAGHFPCLVHYQAQVNYH